ncbi:MAG: hypothetical protein MZV70_66175 [Desulfobacterales bacterium]|nr:hypothetical protein [Desulfobacterales bacterium]
MCLFIYYRAAVLTAGLSESRSFEAFSSPLTEASTSSSDLRPLWSPCPCSRASRREASSSLCVILDLPGRGPVTKQGRGEVSSSPSSRRSCSTPSGSFGWERIFDSSFEASAGRPGQHRRGKAGDMGGLPRRDQRDFPLTGTRGGTCAHIFPRYKSPGPPNGSSTTPPSDYLELLCDGGSDIALLVGSLPFWPPCCGRLYRSFLERRGRFVPFSSSSGRSPASCRCSFTASGAGVLCPSCQVNLSNT